MTQTLQLLLIVQVCLGAFDTLYHHEFTERLPWRTSQKDELRLHGTRNLIYAVFFVAISFIELTGLFAWLLGAAIGLELLVTLQDFVEEDQTRKLPASERVTHTLMAFNFGAIVALMAPMLSGWARQPTGIDLAIDGYWSAIMAFASVAVALFGIRDLLAARRLTRMAGVPHQPLLTRTGKRRSILITGGTGFVGTRLVEALVDNGDAVTVLTRKLASAVHLKAPLSLITDLDQIDPSQQFDAIVNLAGQPTAGWLWTDAYKKQLLGSRVAMTNNLVSLLKRLDVPPDCLINGSAIGAYGVDVPEPTGDDQPVRPDSSFAQRLCREWEAAAEPAAALGVRTVALRIGMVLDTAGGPLGQMLFAFEFGLGGPFGSGDQWMSWITRDDLVRLIDHAIRSDDLAGALNATTPNPAKNIDFARALGKALRRPAVLPVPAILLDKGIGALGREIFLASQNIIPTRALESGFRFESATLEDAFARFFRL